MELFGAFYLIIQSRIQLNQLFSTSEELNYDHRHIGLKANNFLSTC